MIHPSQQPDDDLHQEPTLSSADAAAIDALMESRVSAQPVPAPLAQRAAHAASLLGLIDLPHDWPLPDQSATLVDVTLARIARAERSSSADDTAQLVPDDIEALDALVSSGFRAARVPSSLRARAEHIDSIARLISDSGPSTRSTLLVERTMRAVEAAANRRIEHAPLRGGGRFRFADLVSLAAVLLLGFAVAWPVVSTARSYSQRSGCAANFAGIASAMGLYTADNRDQLPMATASFGGSWMNVGTPAESNSANLFTLAREKYAGLDTLACPGNAMAEHAPADADARDWDALPNVSYSYYIMFGKARPTPNFSPHTIILADKSPVVLRAFSNQRIMFPEENSPNHSGKGQWALRADGAATWQTTPNVAGDNIWLSQAQERDWNAIKPHLPAIRKQAPPGASGVLISIRGPVMNGNELPESAHDSFLGP